MAARSRVASRSRTSDWKRGRRPNERPKKRVRDNKRGRAPEQTRRLQRLCLRRPKEDPLTQHPNIHLVEVRCSTCATSFHTRSTAEAISVDVCSNCHPAYTGQT